VHRLRRKTIKSYVWVRHRIKHIPGDLRIWWFTMRHPVEMYKTLQAIDRANEAFETLIAEEVQKERERLADFNPNTAEIWEADHRTPFRHQ